MQPGVLRYKKRDIFFLCHIHEPFSRCAVLSELVFWLIRVDQEETVAFGYMSNFQSFIKQSESQRGAQLFQLKPTSEMSSKGTWSDNHSGLEPKIRRGVCTVSPNTFPLLREQGSCSRGGAGGSSPSEAAFRSNIS